MLLLLTVFCLALLCDCAFLFAPVICLSNRIRYFKGKEKRRLPANDAHVGTHTLLQKKNSFLYLFDEQSGDAKPLCRAGVRVEGGEKISGGRWHFPLLLPLCITAFALYQIAVPILRKTVVDGMIEHLNRVETLEQYESYSPLPEHYDNGGYGLYVGEQQAFTDDCLNILLAGTDARDYEGASDINRADALFLVSMNRTSKHLNLIPLQRDILVEPYQPFLLTASDMCQDINFEDQASVDLLRKIYVELYPDRKELDANMKLGETLSFAKSYAATDMPDELKSVAQIESQLRALKLNCEKTFQIQIDGAFLVGFDSVGKLVDAFFPDGVLYEIPQSEVFLKELNKIVRGQNQLLHYDSSPVTGGLNHLDGNGVLSYCRIRHDGVTNSNTKRALRQSEILKSIVEQLMHNALSNPMQTLRQCSTDAMNDALKFVYTDLTASQMRALFDEIASEIYQYNITAHDTIPESGRFDNITVDGTAYIYVDSEKFSSLQQQLRAAME